MLAKIFKNAAVYEDNLLAIALAGVVGFIVCPVLGFYLGTVFGSAHVKDLQTEDIINGFKGAGVGLVVGVIGAVYASFVYPRVTKRDGDYGDSAHH